MEKKKIKIKMNPSKKENLIDTETQRERKIDRDREREIDGERERETEIERERQTERKK